MMTRVLAGSLSRFAESHIITESQDGFRPGRGRPDQVQVLRRVCDIVSGDTDIFGTSGLRKAYHTGGEKDCG